MQSVANERAAEGEAVLLAVVRCVTEAVNPIEFFYELPASESQAKYVLYSLNYGFVDGLRFARRFGVFLQEVYNEQLDYALAAGWLSQSNGRWQLAPGQFKRMHAIRSLFYPLAAQRWLRGLSSLPQMELCA